MILSQELKRARKKKHWTQEELGRCVGMRQGDVSYYEREAENPGLQAYRRMFQALGYDLHITLRRAT